MFMTPKQQSLKSFYEKFIFDKDILTIIIILNSYSKEMTKIQNKLEDQRWKSAIHCEIFILVNNH